MPVAYLEKLNPEQRRAVEHGIRENACAPAVPLPVIAGSDLLLSPRKHKTFANILNPSRWQSRSKSHHQQPAIPAIGERAALQERTANGALVEGSVAPTRLKVLKHAPLPFDDLMDGAVDLIDSVVVNLQSQ